MKKYFIVLVVSYIFASCTNTHHENIKIGFVGDILLDRGVRKEMDKRGIDNFYDKLHGQLQPTDYLIGNLECPLTQIYNPVHKRFVFRADTTNAAYLRACGFTHLSMANNHAYDQGREGLEHTYYVLKNKKIQALGFGNSLNESCKPITIDSNDIHISIFATVTLALENWYPLPQKPCICQDMGDSFINRVATYASSNPEKQIVIYIHWGIEHFKEPSPRQKKLAKSLIDVGADLIIGHHPHVLQKHEIYKEKHIFYSLGNFIFDQKDSINTSTEMLLADFNNTGYEIVSKPYKIINSIPYLKKNL